MSDIFDRERRLERKLDHPNIVMVCTCGAAGTCQCCGGPA
jgi:hypothetical protein